jgi:prepilin-type N-terminal cleavage/methylation domain-containing protein
MIKQTNIERKQQRISQNKGFTLVELSIVLVIIGLIVGGVVGGQALIASAKISSTVSDFSKYKTAYNAFDLQYDAIPGDFAEASDYWTTTESGNGNGQIEYTFTAPATSGQDEAYQAWLHMALSEIITSSADGNGVASATNLTIAEDVAVKSEIKGGYFHIGFNTIHGKSTNYLNLTGAGLFSKTSGTGGIDVLSPKQAMQIDKKLDDGSAATGGLRAMNSSADDSGAPSATSCLSGTNASSAPTYLKSTTVAACTLHYALN